MNTAQVMGLVRHLVTVLGASAVTTGYMSQDQLIQIAGGIAILAGVIWSFMSKKDN